MMNVRERLLAMSHIDKLTGCRVWQCFKDKKGYGMIHLDGRKGKVWRAHRLMWTLEMGEIPKGMMIRHLCHNPSCINIHHLALGTNQMNMNDMVHANRQNKCKGSKQGIAKLTERQVKHIHELYEQGLSLRAIARKYGVTFGNIWKIIKRRAWRHVS